MGAVHWTLCSADEPHPNPSPEGEGLFIAPILAMTPRGKPITQARIRELAHGPGVTIICGRFEGFDERLFDARPQIEQVSMGDIILSGGEMGALMLTRRLHSAASRRNGRGFQWG